MCQESLHVSLAKPVSVAHVHGSAEYPRNTHGACTAHVPTIIFFYMIWHFQPFQPYKQLQQNQNGSDYFGLPGWVRSVGGDTKSGLVMFFLFNPFCLFSACPKKKETDVVNETRSLPFGDGLQIHVMAWCGLLNALLAWDIYEWWTFHCHFM